MVMTFLLIKQNTGKPFCSYVADKRRKRSTIAIKESITRGDEREWGCPLSRYNFANDILPDKIFCQLFETIFVAKGRRDASK